MRLLLAEDERVLAEQIKATLSSEGHVVDVSHDGEDAAQFGGGVAGLDELQDLLGELVQEVVELLGRHLPEVGGHVGEEALGPGVPFILAAEVADEFGDDLGVGIGSHLSLKLQVGLWTQQVMGITRLTSLQLSTRD